MVQYRYYCSRTTRLQYYDYRLHYNNSITTVSDDGITIIKHARKSVLFHNNHTWSKRNTDIFDVTMLGSFDGAEVCELVGLFILNSLQKLFRENVRLHREDGLAALNTKYGRLCDKARKDLSHTFNEFGLSITAVPNQTSTNFLVVTFDLTNGTYKAYRKLNDKPLYINLSSSHRLSYDKFPSQLTNGLTHALSCDKRLT